MTIQINDEAVELFSGATVADALRMVDKKLFYEVRDGEKTVRDAWDNERDLDGELSDGDQLRVS
jgi:hypothetical protein